jgi:hypothetical protein
VCIDGTLAGHLVVDALGTVSSGVVPLATGPTRLLDTRATGRGESLNVRVGAAPAGSVALMTVTADRAGNEGFVSVVECGGDVVDSTVNQRPGRALANLAAAAVSNGTVCLRVMGQTDVIVDHLAWLQPASGYRPQRARLFDSRSPRS